MEKVTKVKGSAAELQMCELGTDGDTGTYGHHHRKSQDSTPASKNQVSAVMLFGVPIVSLVMDGKERLCLAQISSTLLKEFSYNEIHNRRVALGITCIQCTPVQLEILRRAGAMPVTSRRCGMITRREAERLCQSFLGDHAPPQLPENFAFEVYHECAWGCRGNFIPSRYNSSRAKCIRCSFCQLFFSPNKFIFHSHRLPDSRYVQPDAANFNSWRRHLRLCGDPPEDVSSLSSPSFKHVASSPGDTNSHNTPKHSKPHLTPASSAHCDVDVVATAQVVHAWEDVKAMFNGGTRKRLLAAHSSPSPPKRTTAPKISPPASYGSRSPSGERSPEMLRQPSQVAPITQGSMPRQHLESAVFLAPIPRSPPFLTPGKIWNPGVSNTNDKNRCQVDPNQIHNLPLAIHPLSIPWLRRPPFPFGPASFEPHCKYISEEPHLFPEMVPHRSTVSAFKPVRQQQSAAEQIFSTWLNNSTIPGNFLQVPEDLSLSSGSALNTNSNSPFYSPPGSNLPPRLIDFGKITTKDSKITERQVSIEKRECHGHKPEPENSYTDSSTSDEETVDVESTDSEQKRDLVKSSQKVPKRPSTEDDDSNVQGRVSSSSRHLHAENNQSTPVRPGQKGKKKKRSWDFHQPPQCTSPE